MWTVCLCGFLIEITSRILDGEVCFNLRICLEWEGLGYKTLTRPTMLVLWSWFKPGTYQTRSFAELTLKFQTCGTRSRKFRAPSPTPNDWDPRAALTSTGLYQDRESLESFFNCFGWNIKKYSKKSGFGTTVDKFFCFKSNTQFINQLLWTQSAAQYVSQKETKPKKWI
jgi:hypothetical protein